MTQINYAEELADAAHTVSYVAENTEQLSYTGRAALLDDAASLLRMADCIEQEATDGE